MSFAMRLAEPDLQENIEIRLITGESPDDGKPIYHYLALYSDMVRDLNLSLMLKTTELEQYGVILASGEGVPDDDTKAYVAEFLS